MSESPLLKELSEFDDEGEWKLDAESSFYRNVKEIVDSFKNSKMSVLDFAVNDAYPDSARVMVCGGLNGPGRWMNYLADIFNLFKRLELEVGFTWVIKLNNDCCDDVWYLTIGMEKN